MTPLDGDRCLTETDTTASILIAVRLFGKNPFQPFMGVRPGRIKPAAKGRESLAQFVEKLAGPFVFRRENCDPDQEKKQTLKKGQKKPRHTQDNKAPPGNKSQPALESSCHKVRRTGPAVTQVQTLLSAPVTMQRTHTHAHSFCAQAFRPVAAQNQLLNVNRGNTDQDACFAPPAKQL
jgi:hypothetical protein